MNFIKSIKNTVNLFKPKAGKVTNIVEANKIIDDLTQQLGGNATATATATTPTTPAIAAPATATAKAIEYDRTTMAKADAMVKNIKAMEAGLRVISGRYATNQIYDRNNKTVPSDSSTSVSVPDKASPLHLYIQKKDVKTDAGKIVKVTVELSEADFRSILDAKPDYQSLLRSYQRTNGELYLERVALDYLNKTVIW